MANRNNLSINADVGVNFVKSASRSIIYAGKSIAEAGGGGGTTINNQDLYVTSNGTYTASEGYTGLGEVTVALPLDPKSITENGTYYAVDDELQGYDEVTVNVPTSDMVTAKNTTNSAIAQNDRVCLEKVSGGWNIVPSIKNFAVTGTLTESNKTFSGFTTSNYISLYNTFRPASSTWEVVFRFKGIGSGLLMAKSNSSSYAWNGFILSTTGDGGKLYYVIAKTSSTALFTATGSHVLSDDWNWVKFVFTGTEYIGYYSTDGANWETDMTYSSSTAIFDSASETYIGVRHVGNFAPFLGEIDLGHSYIKIGGSYSWVPFYQYDLPQYFEGVAGEAIANNASGDVKTALPEQVTVTVTASADNAEITAV